MEISFDPIKSFKNELQRRLSFEEVADFEWDTAVLFEDKRFQYPEMRLVATGFLGERLHVVCFTPLASNSIRIISFRKANLREVKQYEEKIEILKKEAASEGEAANEQRW